MPWLTSGSLERAVVTLCCMQRSARAVHHLASASRFSLSMFPSRPHLTMRSSGPRGEAIVFPGVISARGRLTRR
jgi:hypothetical protein